MHMYNLPGFYDVGLLITNPVTGCKAGFLLEEMVKIFKTPEARFIVDYPVALLDQADLKFTNQTSYGERFHWDFGDGNTSGEEHPRHEYRQVGQFQVLLEAVSG
ncbi:PKD domain-containing protein, partial [Enterococcus faecalis]